MRKILLSMVFCLFSFHGNLSLSAERGAGNPGSREANLERVLRTAAFAASLAVVAPTGKAALDSLAARASEDPKLIASLGSRAPYFVAALLTSLASHSDHFGIQRDLKAKRYLRPVMQTAAGVGAGCATMDFLAPVGDAVSDAVSPVSPLLAAACKAAVVLGGSYVAAAAASQVTGRLLQHARIGDEK